MQQPFEDEAEIDTGFCTDAITSEDLAYTLVGMDPDRGEMRICLVYESEEGTRSHISMDSRTSAAIMRALGLYCQAAMKAHEKSVEVPDGWPPTE